MTSTRVRSSEVCWLPSARSSFLSQKVPADPLSPPFYLYQRTFRLVRTRPSLDGVQLFGDESPPLFSGQG